MNEQNQLTKLRISSELIVECSCVMSRDNMEYMKQDTWSVIAAVE